MNRFPIVFSAVYILNDMKKVIALLFIALGLTACVPVEKITEISEKSYVVIVKTERVLLVVEEELQGTELQEEIGDEIDDIQMAIGALKRTIISMIILYGGEPPMVDALTAIVCGCSDCSCGAECISLCSCDLKCECQSKDLRNAVEELESLL